MVLFAIDPGMAGAVLFDHAGRWEAFRMPVVRVAKGRGYRSTLDPVALISVIERQVDHAPRVTGSSPRVFGLLERQAPHRGQGFFGNASIMQSYGMLQGTLSALRLPYATIDPQDWRKAMRLPPAKEQSWLLLGRQCPELAAMVGSWPKDNRIAVADCYCMLAAAERLRMIQRPAPADDWLA